MSVFNTFLLLVCLLFQFTSSFAQIEANNWCFGQNAAISFDTSPPTPLSGFALNTIEGCSVISDSGGDLLFYTDGVSVWDKTHQVMPNGTGLQGHASSSQSAIIIPAPGLPLTYYIVTAPVSISSTPMSYSIVDLSQNGGLGDVVVKNTTLLTNSTEKVSVTQHQNGIDYWIVAHEFGNSNFNSFQVTQSGINPAAIISAVGNAIIHPMHATGIIKISPGGNKIAMTDYGAAASLVSTLELFNFDNATGQVSNPMLLDSSVMGFYGIEFSTDNQKLYKAFLSPGVIVQYDLSSGNMASIIASADTIGIQTTSGFGSGFFALQLGPDGKIYVAKSYEFALGCIQNPSLPGAASNYNDNYVTLGNKCMLGLPGFITSWFSNLNTSIALPEENDLTISPNPFSSQISVSLPFPLTPDVVVSLTTLNGKKCEITTTIQREPGQLEIDAGHAADGVYILEITTPFQILRKKIVKLNRNY